MANNTSLPLLAITMGDPAGCGSEIIAKVLTNDDVYTLSLPIVIGSAPVMRWALDVLGKQAKVLVIEEPRMPNSFQELLMLLILNFLIFRNWNLERSSALLERQHTNI